MMENRMYQCLVVDDEPPARDLLVRYVDQLPMLAMAGDCGNALQAMALLQRRQIDLLFLDIHMPRLSGIDLIKSLRHPPKIILTTAYDQYAMQAFDLDVVDYLLKPISFERFVKAVMKAIPPDPSLVSRDTPPTGTAEPPFLYFRSDRKMVKVLLDNIFFVESLKDYLRIVTGSGEVITKHSMAALETLLPQNDFIRVHRSFIVAVNKISSYSAERIALHGATVPIGKLYRLQVLRLLDSKFR